MSTHITHDIAYSILLHINNLDDLKSMIQVCKSFNIAAEKVLINTGIYFVRISGMSFGAPIKPCYREFENFKDAVEHYFERQDGYEEGYTSLGFNLFRKFIWKDKTVGKLIVSQPCKDENFIDRSFRLLLPKIRYDFFFFTKSVLSKTLEDFDLFSQLRNPSKTFKLVYFQKSPLKIRKCPKMQIISQCKKEHFSIPCSFF